MATLQLRFVETLGHARDSLRNFDAAYYADSRITRNLLTHTTYWVYDPASRQFGPFVIYPQDDNPGSDLMILDDMQ